MFDQFDQDTDQSGAHTMKMNFLEISSSSLKFQRFVRDHALLKFAYGKHFPHHAQVVSVLSIIEANKKSCDRTLGQDDTRYICVEDLTKS